MKGFGRGTAAHLLSRVRLHKCIISVSTGMIRMDAVKFKPGCMNSKVFSTFLSRFILFPSCPSPPTSSCLRKFCMLSLVSKPPKEPPFWLVDSDSLFDIKCSFLPNNTVSALWPFNSIVTSSLVTLNEKRIESNNRRKKGKMFRFSFFFYTSWYCPVSSSRYHDSVMGFPLSDFILPSAFIDLLPFFFSFVAPRSLIAFLPNMFGKLMTSKDGGLEGPALGDLL